MVKILPAVQETQVRSLGGEDPLKKGMATHFSILTWLNPWTEEPGGLHTPWSCKESDRTEETNVPMHKHDLFFSLSVLNSLGQEVSKNLGRCS